MNFKRLQYCWSTVIVYVALAILVVLLSLLSDKFLGVRNLENLLCASVAVALVSIGQTFVLLSEGIDLSVGSVVSLTTCLTAGLINGQASLVLPVVGLVIITSLFIGFCNGMVIVKAGVSPLIVTLGMMSVVQGAAYLYAIGPVGSVPTFWGFWAWGKIGPFPVPVIILASIAAIGIIIQKKTVFGRYVFAVGSSDEVARLAGIKTGRIRVLVYMICSLTACLTGLYLTSRMGMGEPVVGTGYMIDSIVPVLIGGTAFEGGRGGIVGTLAGVFIFTVLMNAVNLLGVSTYWQWMIEGGIIVSVAAIYKPKI